MSLNGREILNKINNKYLNDTLHLDINFIRSPSGEFSTNYSIYSVDLGQYLINNVTLLELEEYVRSL